LVLTAGVSHQLECIGDVLHGALTGVVSNGVDVAQDTIGGWQEANRRHRQQQGRHTTTALLVSNLVARVLANLQLRG
jgi:hypothetical protein